MDGSVTKFQIITVAVAAYAAVVSTLTGAVQLFNYRRDRAQIKLTARHDMLIVGDSIYADQTVTIVKVVNRGRRPVTITSVGASRLHPHLHFVLPDCRPDLPHELTEGKSLIAIMGPCEMDFSTIESWHASDAVGRTYKLHIAPWYSRVLSQARLRRALRRKAKGKVQKVETKNDKNA